MAAMIGFAERSMSRSVSLQLEPGRSLPNSMISAPTKKLRPLQIMTPTLHSSCAFRYRTAWDNPDRTVWLMAFTGGLSHQKTAVASLISSDTELESACIIFPGQIRTKDSSHDGSIFTWEMK